MGRRTLHRLELEAGDGAGAQLAAEADAPVLGLDDLAGDYKLSLSPTTAVRRGTVARPYLNGNLAHAWGPSRDEVRALDLSPSAGWRPARTLIPPRARCECKCHETVPCRTGTRSRVRRPRSLSLPTHERRGPVRERSGREWSPSRGASW